MILSDVLGKLRGRGASDNASEGPALDMGFYPCEWHDQGSSTLGEMIDPPPDKYLFPVEGSTATVFRPPEHWFRRRQLLKIEGTWTEHVKATFSPRSGSNYEGFWPVDGNADFGDPKTYEHRYLRQQADDSWADKTRQHTGAQAEEAIRDINERIARHERHENHLVFYKMYRKVRKTVEGELTGRALAQKITGLIIPFGEFPYQTEECTSEIDMALNFALYRDLAKDEELRKALADLVKCKWALVGAKVNKLKIYTGTQILLVVPKLSAYLSAAGVPVVAPAANAFVETVAIPIKLVNWARAKVVTFIIPRASRLVLNINREALAYTLFDYAVNELPDMEVQPARDALRLLDPEFEKHERLLTAEAEKRAKYKEAVVQLVKKGT